MLERSAGRGAISFASIRKGGKKPSPMIKLKVGMSKSPSLQQEVFFFHYSSSGLSCNWYLASSLAVEAAGEIL